MQDLTALPARIASKIGEPDDNGCWPWLASKSQGYGNVYLDGRSRRAHRVVYEILVGPVPDELVPDHLCRNRGCVNPSHIEVVTIRENSLRGFGWAGIHARKTHCPAGHPYDEKNTYRYGPGRQCRACHKARNQAARAKIARSLEAQDDAGAGT